jgi:hypothetical protein
MDAAAALLADACWLLLHQLLGADVSLIRMQLGNQTQQHTQQAMHNTL